MKPYIFNKRVKTKIWVTIQVDPKMKISRRGKIFIDHLTLVENNVETLPHRYYTGIIPVYFHSFNRIKIPFGISNSFQLKGINKKTQPMARSRLFRRKNSTISKFYPDRRRFIEWSFWFFRVYVNLVTSWKIGIFVQKSLELANGMNSYMTFIFCATSGIHP